MTSKDKILIWLDIGLNQIAISKFLKEKHDCDLFSIIDCSDQLKQFFLKQDLIKFEKTWFYRDETENHDNFDLTYLKKFENTYKINLWNLLYTERYFYKFNPYHKFSKNEILSLICAECMFFEKVLDEINPDFVIMRTTDYHQNYLFHEICVKKGIKVLQLSHARIGFRSMISTTADLFDEYNLDNFKTSKNRSFVELREYINKYSDQLETFRKRRISKFLKIQASIKFLLFICNSKYRKFYANYGRTRLKVLKTELSNISQTRNAENFLQKHSVKDIPTTPFIYYPLHVEPERSLSIIAPYFTNQIETITHISKSIPIDYVLCVKEHPNQKFGNWRKISYYKKLLELPNVVFLHPSVSSKKLIENSSLVMTISGTTGFEAAFYDKHSILFSDVLFSPLKSVHRIKNMEDLPEIIRENLDKHVDLENLNNYINFMEKNSFLHDLHGMTTEWYHSFFYDGFIKEVEIEPSKMDEFLEKHKVIFETLVDEHIKKIKYHKEQKTFGHKKIS